GHPKGPRQFLKQDPVRPAPAKPHLVPADSGRSVRRKSSRDRSRRATRTSGSVYPAKIARAFPRSSRRSIAEIPPNHLRLQVCPWLDRILSQTPPYRSPCPTPLHPASIG